MFLTFLFHLLITLPSIIYHETYDQYLRYVYIKRYDTLPAGIHDVIVFIHGRGGHYTCFETLIKKLQSEVKFQVLTVDLGNNANTSIVEDVETMYQQLNPLMSQINRMTLIGVSKGGLVAIKYTIEYPEKVDKIITVSAPLSGTKVATYYPFCKVTREELGYMSPLTEELKEKSKELAIFSIVPRFDHLIIPNDSACFSQSRCYFYRGYYSHQGILYAPKVMAAISRWIKYC